MAEDQSQQPQTDPQLIMWDKVNGVFRLARLKMPNDFVEPNLEQNVELQEPEISPDALSLMSSVYLGPINIYEEHYSGSNITSFFQRLKEYKHGIVSGIVILAENVAKQQRVPYFGVTIVKTEKDITWKFEAKEPLFDECLIKEKYDLSPLFEKNQPQKPVEFVLHPTAQLYVQRK